MNIRISLPSGVNEGENLPLQFAVPDSGLEAPRVDCGFAGLNCDVTLRRRPSGGWQGVANVHSGLAGHAFLKFRLSDPSCAGRCWEGEIGVRFAPRQQAAPIHITGVDSSAEKSGLGQANSVNITVNGLASGGGGASAQVHWQEIEVMLHECALPLSLPRSPAPAPVPPVNPMVAAREPASASQAKVTDASSSSGAVRETTVGTIARGNSMMIAAAMLILIVVVSYLAISNHERGADVVKTDPPAFLESRPSASNFSQAAPDAGRNGYKPSSQSPGLNAASEHPAETSLPQKPIVGVESPITQASSSAIEVQGLAATYQSGDALKFQVRLAKPGYLRLQTCDPAGAAIQLYPCQHDAIKEFPAGQWISLPDPDLLAKIPNATYECYVPDGKTREITQVRLQWSPFPFEPTGLRGAGEFFYEPSQPATWGDLATRGVRLKLDKPAVESKELTFEVVKP